MARIDPSYEIKVAVLGYVSVGKTTVLNALLRDQYGEVAMRRTTAAINYFRISTPPPTDTTTNSTTSSAERTAWTMVPTDEPRPAQATLEQITSDNARLRNVDDASPVEEVWFDIELDQSPLLSSNTTTKTTTTTTTTTTSIMRNDTKLVLVDIPGINEAGSSSKYQEYVDKKWHTFDVVLLVMDGRQGVNTEEQVNLLKFARNHQRNTKAIPVLILSNKIDDPEENEQMLLTKEAQLAVETTFETSNQAELLQQILKHAAASETADRGTNPSPNAIFIPISAMHAFIYQTGPRLNLAQFSKLDPDLIEKIGKENYGFEWRRMDKAAKIKAAYQAVQQVDMRNEGLALSNFQTLNAVLTWCIGGPKTQTNILKQQIDEALSRMVQDPMADLTAEIETAYYNSKGVGLPTDDLSAKFWEVYQIHVDKAFAAFTSVTMVASLSRPMKHLVAYHKFVRDVGLLVEQDKIMSEAMTMIHRQTEMVMNTLETSLTPIDKVLMYGSLLLQANQPFFIQKFGLLKIFLESKYHHATGLVATKKCPYCPHMIGQTANLTACPSCKGAFLQNGSNNCPKYGNMLYHNHHCSKCGTTHCAAPTFGLGSYNPLNPAVIGATVKVPDSFEDPDHFGHLIWLFGTIVQSNQSNRTAH